MVKSPRWEDRAKVDKYDTRQSFPKKDECYAGG